MQKTITGIIALAAGSAALTVGAADASAKVAEGTYNLCIQTRYGSSVDEKCAQYRVVGNSLIGPNGTPLTIVDTPSGGYADIPPLSRITFIKTDEGYKAINSVVGIPAATSTFTPVSN